MSEQPETRGAPDDLTLVISGPFTVEDVGRFAALMREIEVRQPERLFRLVVEDKRPGASSYGRELLERTFPPDPLGRGTEFWKRDLPT